MTGNEEGNTLMEWKSELAPYRPMVQKTQKLPQGTHAVRVKNDIIKIAQNKYGATQSDLSTYGASDSFEFFAEAFANAKSGRPNAIGKAMNDYLRRNKL